MRKKNKYDVGQNVWYTDEERQLVVVATILDMYVIPHDYQSEPRYEIQYSVGNSKITRTEIVESELSPTYIEEQPNIFYGNPGESVEDMMARQLKESNAHLKNLSEIPNYKDPIQRVTAGNLPAYFKAYGLDENGTWGFKADKKQPTLGLATQDQVDDLAKKYKWMRDEFYTLSQSYWDVVKENIALKQKYETTFNELRALKMAAK